MTTFDIRLFGSIEIRRDGARLADFRSQKALVLLAYLISENRPVTRDYLAGLGWPEMEQSQALGLLRRSLHDLNNQLPGCLEMDRRTVCFSPTAPATVDIYQMADLMAQDDFDARVAVIAFYRAPFLHGLYVDDAPELENWLLREQERWQSAIVQVLHRLIDYHTAEVDYDPALVYTQRLLTLEPWREEAHRQAMLLLARTGQVSAALAQYERCRQTLAEELAVAPARETENLHTRIKAIAHATPAPLPVTTTPFVGRTEEVADLTRLLTNHGCRLITLLGPGGMGKTRLALEMARAMISDHQRRFLHGVVFVPLVGAETVAQLVAAVGQTLSFTFQAQSAPQTQLLHYLRDKELLLVLDNFEQLVNAPTATFVRQLLDTAPEVKLLLTSRVRLHLQGEQLYWMQGLHVPMTTAITAPPSVTEMTTYSGVQLFLATVQRNRPHYTLTAGDASAVITICQLVQGMPLALELAAGWITILTPSEIAAELTHDLDFLASEAHDLPLRQRSMRAVFDTSWHLLTAIEQHVFQQLAVFRGSFARSAAQAVTGATLPVLNALVHKCFLQRTANDRYQLHELLCQFAQEQLAHAPALSHSVHQAHAQHYGALLAAQSTAPGEGEVIRTLQTIKAEYDNLRVAWFTLSTEQAIAPLDRALNALYLFYDTESWYIEGITVLNFTLTTLGGLVTWEAVADGAASAQPPVVVFVTRLLNRLARFYFYSGNFLTTAALLDVAFALAQVNGQQSEIAFALARQGHLASTKGESAKALHYHEQSLALYQTLGDHTEIARQFNNLGVVAHNSGRLTEAWQCYQQGYQVAKTNNNPGMLAVILYNFGKVAQELGRYDEAQGYLQESLHYQQLLNDQEGVGYVLHGMAHVLMNRGEYAAAQQQAHQALNIFQQISYQHGIVFTLCILGELAVYLQQYDKGFHFLHGSLTLAREGDFQHDEALVLLILGRLHLTKGELTQAQEYAERSRQLSVDTHAESTAGYAHILLGEIIDAHGDQQMAYAHLQQALSIGQQTATPPLQLNALLAIALLLRQRQPRQSIVIAVMVAQHAATVDITRKRATLLLQELRHNLSAADFQRTHDDGKGRQLATLIEEIVAPLSLLSA